MTDPELLELSKDMARMLDIQKRMVEGMEGVLLEIRNIYVEINKLRDMIDAKDTPNDTQ